ncbi:MAG: thiamine-phosphate kinase [Verrucomicrobia bacterium]|nr:thiamine-phosphate kinase [Verrucomicrobiota bacterium]
MATLKEQGELRTIERLAKLLPGRSDVVLGVGDDTAIVEVGSEGRQLLLTTDPLIEGVHFLPDAPPELIGRKAAGRVLSDFAAMGGEPLWLLVDVVAPGEMEADRLEGVYKGLCELAEKYASALVGGDVAKGPVFELHVFGVGEVPRNSAVRRSGARVGDAIYVTGELGGSLLGRHLEFEPRIEEAMWLRENSWPTAMIDVSDGLATDLRHICDASGVGAEIVLESVPVSESAKKMSDEKSSLHHAMTDGEDFELLFTVPASKRSLFESAWEDTFDLPCSRIGVITDAGMTCIDATGRRPLDEKGYEHFGSE